MSSPRKLRRSAASLLVAGSLAVGGAALAVATPAAGVVGAAAGEAGGWVRSALDGLVGQGTITSDQADAVAEALAEARPEKGHGHPRHHAAHLAIGTAAEVIGVEATDLVAALRDGQSIAAVAEDNGVDVGDVVAALVAEAEDRIAGAEKAGRIDADKAAELTENLEDRITEMVNREGTGLRGGLHRGEGRGPAPAA